MGWVSSPADRRLECGRHEGRVQRLTAVLLPFASGESLGPRNPATPECCPDRRKRQRRRRTAAGSAKCSRNIGRCARSSARLAVFDTRRTSRRFGAARLRRSLWTRAQRLASRGGHRSHLRASPGFHGPDVWPDQSRSRTASWRLPHCLGIQPCDLPHRPVGWCRPRSVRCGDEPRPLVDGPCAAWRRRLGDCRRVGLRVMAQSTGSLRSTGDLSAPVLAATVEVSGQRSHRSPDLAAGVRCRRDGSSCVSGGEYRAEECRVRDGRRVIRAGDDFDVDRFEGFDEVPGVGRVADGVAAAPGQRDGDALPAE